MISPLPVVTKLEQVRSKVTQSDVPSFADVHGTPHPLGHFPCDKHEHAASN